MKTTWSPRGRPWGDFRQYRSFFCSRFTAKRPGRKAPCGKSRAASSLCPFLPIGYFSVSLDLVVLYSTIRRTFGPPLVFLPIGRSVRIISYFSFVLIVRPNHWIILSKRRLNAKYSIYTLVYYDGRYSNGTLYSPSSYLIRKRFRSKWAGFT